MIIIVFSIANPLIRISEIETIGSKFEISLYPYKHTYWEEVYFPITAGVSYKYNNYTFAIKLSMFSSSISPGLINISFESPVLKNHFPLYISLGYISPAYIYGFDFNTSYFNYSALNTGMFIMFTPLKSIDIYIKIGAVSGIYREYSAVENKKNINFLISPVFNTKTIFNIKRFAFSLSFNPFIYPFIASSISYRYR